MPHVVTENCQDCRFTDCVETCPVKCFHGSEDRVYIDPEVCIDCAACVPACPINAIFDEYDLDEGSKIWAERNAEMAKVLPVIDRKQAPRPEALARKAQLGF